MTLKKQPKKYEKNAATFAAHDCESTSARGATNGTSPNRSELARMIESHPDRGVRCLWCGLRLKEPRVFCGQDHATLYMKWMQKAVHMGMAKPLPTRTAPGEDILEGLIVGSMIAAPLLAALVMWGIVSGNV